MSIYDAWIVVDKATWDSIAPEEDAPPEIWHRRYQNAITGFWKQDVYNVLGNAEELAALHTALGEPTIYCWQQGSGLDSLDVFPTDPSGILALMRDHEDSTQPTVERPNWGHVFFGQAERRFAGEFNEDFGEDFL